MRITYPLLLVIVVVAHLFLLLADFVAPYAYDQQNRAYPFAPPTRPHFFDSHGRFHLRPFIYPWTVPSGESIGQYRPDASTLVPIHFFVMGRKHKLLGLVPTSLRLFGTEGGARVFLLGTDALGRDEFSRLLYGGRISIFAGLLAAAISLGFGLIAGTVAGYYGSWTDDLIMRAAETFISVPWLFLLLSIRALLPLHIDAAGLFFLLAAVLGAIGWARPARLVRGVTLSTREREYVQAAKGFGASDSYVLRVHILPAAISVALTQAVLYIPQFVLAEVTLSFFGLGVSEPMPSWGNMLTGLQQTLVLESCPWMFSPAVALIVIFFAYYQLFSRYSGVDSHS